MERKRMTDSTINEAVAELQSAVSDIQGWIDTEGAPVKGPAIFAGIAAVMSDVLGVGKHGVNQSGREKFNYRGVDAVVNAVGPALRAHGIGVMPSRIVSCEYSKAETRSGAIMTHCHLEIEWTWFASDGSTMVASSAAEAFDSGDKATSKAHSVAYRTMLIQALCIPTDEPDPDSFSYEQGAAPAASKPRASRTRTKAAEGPNDAQDGTPADDSQATEQQQDTGPAEGTPEFYGLDVADVIGARKWLATVGQQVGLSIADMSAEFTKWTTGRGAAQQIANCQDAALIVEFTAHVQTFLAQ